MRPVALNTETYLTEHKPTTQTKRMQKNVWLPPEWKPSDSVCAVCAVRVSPCPRFGAKWRKRLRSEEALHSVSENFVTRFRMDTRGSS